MTTKKTYSPDFASRHLQSFCEQRSLLIAARNEQDEYAASFAERAMRASADIVLRYGTAQQRKEVGAHL